MGNGYGTEVFGLISRQKEATASQGGASFAPGGIWGAWWSLTIASASFLSSC